MAIKTTSFQINDIVTLKDGRVGIVKHVKKHSYNVEFSNEKIENVWSFDIIEEK